MLISVVIPSVERREQLHHAVRTALCQRTSFAFEVVIIDNSREGTQAWILDAVRQTGASRDRRCIHESRSGLASARNRGVAEAKGEYVVFLDDDEWPLSETWLEQLVSAAVVSGADASFGPVRPEFEIQPTQFGDYLNHVYTRELHRPDLSPINDLVAMLGTGNSCFRRQTSFAGAAFSLEFNRTGGEDMDLLFRMKRAGRQFVWAANAPVAEFVPVAKLQQHDLAGRRFRQGQQRSYLQIASRRRRYDTLLFWMMVGVVQTALYGVRHILAQLAGESEKAKLHWIKMHGGLGKIFWQAKYRAAHYGQ